MRLGPIPESPLERILLAAGLVPVPLADTLGALLLARTVMTATKLGLFEALADGPLTAGQVASRCDSDPRATGKLLFALAGARYVRAENQRYALAPMARKWLLKASRTSLHDAVLHRLTADIYIPRPEELRAVDRADHGPVGGENPRGGMVSAPAQAVRTRAPFIKYVSPPIRA